MFLMLMCIIFFILMLPIPAGILSFAFIFLYKDKRSIYCLLFFLLSLSFLTILYIPNSSDDLTRYFETMSSLEYIPTWKDYFSFALNDNSMQYQSANKIFNILQYLISRTRLFTLLPTVAMNISYFSILFPVIDLKNKGKLSNRDSLFTSIGNLMIVHLFYTVNTMRWAIACSLLYLIVYIYFYKLNNILYLWLFLLPILFHIGIILGVVIACYVALFKRTRIWSLLLLIVVFFAFLFLSKNGLLGQSGGLVGQLSGMTNTYSNDFMNRNMNGLLVLYLEKASAFCLIFAFFVVYLKRPRTTPNFVDRFTFMITLFFILLVGNSMIQNRYMIVTSLFLLLFCVQNIRTVSNAYKSLSVFLIVLAIFLLIIPVIAANKNMNFTIPFWQIFFSNVLTLIRNVPFF